MVVAEVVGEAGKQFVVVSAEGAELAFELLEAGGERAGG